MQNAIEFITKKKQGKMIEIPAEYIDKVQGEFRVILILNKKQNLKITKKTEPKSKIIKTTKTKSKTPQRTFKAFKVKTKGFKFNRDDAYNE